MAQGNCCSFSPHRGWKKKTKRWLAKRRKQLMRKQGRHHTPGCVGRALCARAVIVDDDGTERFLGLDEDIAETADGSPGGSDGSRGVKWRQAVHARSHINGVSGLGDFVPAAAPAVAEAQLILAPGTRTGYRGVSYDRDRELYRATIIVNGRKRRRDFATALEAARCYARHAQPHVTTQTQQAQAVGDDGLLWQLRTSPRSLTGYVGVESLASRRGLARPFRARYGKQEIGYFETAIRAAVAYAQFESMIGELVSGGNTPVESVLVDPPHPGASELSCCGQGGSDLDWGEQSHGDHGCGEGCSEQDRGSMGCGSQGRGGMGCGNLGCGDFSCSGLSCGDLGCDGPGSDDLELLLGL